MKLVESAVKYLPQQSSLTGIYKQIEHAGRVCYKSEDKITSGSAKDFVDRMIKSGHTAMLEHGTVYLELYGLHNECELLNFYQNNPYSKVVRKVIRRESEDGNVKGFLVGYFITTNYRVIVENDRFDDLKFISQPTEYHERRITLRFVTDRGVSHELVRHRVFSFAQESTRYCNYSKDKFDNELTFIKPSWYDEAEENTKIVFDTLLDGSENAYLNLLNHQCSPQQARQVLPNALKTEIVMTGFASDWKHFFDLRYYGTTGKPHPDMVELTTKAKKVLEDNNLWNLIYK